MADLELLCLDNQCRTPDSPSSANCVLTPQHIHKSSGSAGRIVTREPRFNLAQRACVHEGDYDSAPRTATSKDRALKPPVQDNDVNVCCDEEFETSFAHVDENVNIKQAFLEHSPKNPCGPSCQSPANENQQEQIQELSIISDDELASEATGKSVDYGFISAVTFLMTGISLVVISYAVPRDVKVNPDGVSAREMERLEKESARIGAHLDRCVIAGLCLLTLGGVVLSTLLMVSLWKGEMFRRKAFAYSKQSAKLYGSINFRLASSPTRASPHHSEDEENRDNIN